MSLAKLVVLSLAAAACGPSLAEVRRARNAVYQADFQEVWRAVSEEVGKRYPQLRARDPATGLVWSAWTHVKTVEVTDGEDGLGREERQRHDRWGGVGRVRTSMVGGGGKFKAILNNDHRTRGPEGEQGERGLDFFQARVQIVGDPGAWRVEVEGEAAALFPGSPTLRPYPRGSEGEPLWVQSRIDELVLGIHRRLEKRELRTAAR